MNDSAQDLPTVSSDVLLRLESASVTQEALLKTCYWFSRDFTCNIRPDTQGATWVTLKSKAVTTLSEDEIRERFVTQVLDFTLREKIASATSGVRDLLLAKAFSESGVLEDAPEGVFGDRIEEAKPQGMFKILSNS